MSLKEVGLASQRQRLPFKKTGRGKNGSVKPALPSHLESERAARMQGLQLKREQYTASVNQLSLEVTSPAAWMLNPDGLLMRRPGDQTPAAEPPPVPVVENPDTEQVTHRHYTSIHFSAAPWPRRTCEKLNANLR